MVRARGTMLEWVAWSGAAAVLPIVTWLGFAFLFPLLLKQNSPSLAMTIATVWGLAIAIPLWLATIPFVAKAREMLTANSETSSGPRSKARDRMRLTLTIMSIAVMLVGIWWLLQGTGVAPLGFMANHLTWAFRGAVLFLLGLLTMLFAQYR